MMKSLKTLAVLIALFIAVPLFIVVPMSFSANASLQFPPSAYWWGNYQHFFSDINWMQPLFNSLYIGLATTLLTLALAIPASFALVRHYFIGRTALNLLLMLPMIVPQIVMALGYYLYFGRLHLTQSFTGIIIVHTCLGIPVATLILTAALRSFDANLEHAAHSLGAPALTTFWLVTLPVLRPAVLVAGLFAFIQSFDETVIAVFISGRDTATLPRQMFNSFRMEADPVISAASSFLFILVLAALLLPLAVRLTRRSSGSAAGHLAR
ncbi:ABC transporter permease [Pseudomonas sp. C2L11]|uniref:ABC transporter permease n=2 Tax=Pseudomonas typographi TaxID=2715964 RepID=A0ABR7YVD1_9PSED|nr:ABC transporter permease [Pseudomonas typographi]MBD1597157.1 ABC transporter permease [Pseudomonas typographi]